MTTAPEHIEGRAGSGRRGCLRHVMRLGILMCILVVAVLVLASTPWGVTRAVRFVAERYNPLDGTTIKFDRASGFLFSHLKVRNARLVDESGREALAVDTLGVSYNLAAAVRGRVSLSDVDMLGLRFEISEDSSGRWHPFITANPDTLTPDTISVILRRVTIRRATGVARFYNADRDSLLSLHALDADMSWLTFGDEFTGRVDSMSAEFSPPTLSDTVAVSFAGELSADLYDVARFRLSSPASDVSASGRLAFIDDVMGNSTVEIDGQVSANPISFRDVTPFLPFLDPNGKADIAATMATQRDSIRFGLNVSTSDGGTLSASGVLPTRRSSPFALTTVANGRDLNPALFARGSPEWQGKLSPTLTLDLRGDSLSTATGSGKLRLPAGTIGGRRLVDADVTFDIDRGFWKVNGNVTAARTVLAVNGTGRPFDATPAYDITLRGRNVDLATIVGPSSPTSRINGTLTARGNGFSLADANADVALSLTQSTIADAVIERATLNGELAEGRFSFRSELQSIEGGVSLTGTLVTEDTVDLTISEGRTNGLNVMPFLSDTTGSYLDGGFTLEVRGNPMADGILKWTATLDSVAYADFGVSRLVTSGGLSRGRLDGTFDTAIAGGRFAGSAAGSPLDVPRSITISDAFFRNIDLAKLGVADVDSSRLSGTLEGRVTSLDPATTDGRFAVVLAPSFINIARVDTASIAGTIVDGVLDARGTMVTGTGSAEVVLSGRPFADRPQLTASAAVVRLDVGAFLGDERYRTSLTGSVQGNLEGRTFSEMTGRLQVDLDSSTVNDFRFGRLTSTIGVDSSDARVDVAAAYDNQTGILRGTVSQTDGQTSFALTGLLPDFDFGAVLGLDSTAAVADVNLELEGTGTNIRNIAARGAVSSRTVRFGDLNVTDLQSDFDVRDGRVLVDSLIVRSNVGEFIGSGTISLYDSTATVMSDFRLAGHVESLAPLSQFLPNKQSILGDGPASLRLRGRAGNLQFMADGEFDRVAYGQLRIGDVDARISGRLSDGNRLDLWNFRLSGTNGSIPQFTFRDFNVDAAYAADSVAYTITTVIDDRREATIDGIAGVGEDRFVRLDEVQIRLDNDFWTLLQPTVITFDDAYRVRNLLLFTTGQQIAVDGIIDLDGEQSLLMTLENFQVGSIADLFGYSGLAGPINGFIDLTGDSRDPSLSSQLSMDVRSFGEAVGDLALQADYDDLRLNLEGVLTHQDGSTLRVTGFVPVDLRLSKTDSTLLRVAARQADDESEVDLTIDADSFSIGWIRPFLNPKTFAEPAGKLQGSLKIEGTSGNPDLSGSAQLFDGRLRLPVFAITYHSIRADVEFQGDQILVRHAEIRSGDGSLIGTGTVSATNLALGEFDIDASSERFLAVDNRSYRAVAASDVSLTGTTRSPRVAGTVELDELEVRLNEEIEELETVVLSTRDIQTVERRFGIRISEDDTTTYNFYDALAMNIEAKLGRNTWLRSRASPAMDIQFTGDLDVQKSANEDANFYGTIEVIPERSRIEQFGRQFRIERGTMTYNGPIDDPAMDLAARYRVRSRGDLGDEVNIYLQATGHLEDLEITLDSDPKLETTDIVSYIAFGRPAGETLHLGGSSGGELAADLAVSQVAGLVEGLAGSELGLDVVEIEQQGLNARLTAGKFVSTRLYVSISQPISFSGSTGSTGLDTHRAITVEYEVFERILLRLLREERSVRVSLSWQYHY